MIKKIGQTMAALGVFGAFVAISGMDAPDPTTNCIALIIFLAIAALGGFIDYLYV